MVNVPWCHNCNEPDGLCICVGTREQPQVSDPQDFALNIYRGCVLPEDYRPVRATSWLAWVVANPDEYSERQLELVRRRLLSGKSWVTFCKVLETISASDYYRPVSQTPNSRTHK